jgi:hypothetical protein
VGKCLLLLLRNGGIIGKLELADMPGASPGKRTFFVAKRLAFNQIGLQSRSID